jgi:hypothetical protein
MTTKKMDPEQYRRDLRNMGASKKDADTAVEQLKRQQGGRR